MTAPELSDEETERYARHIILDEIGFDGQARLAASHAVVIGAGGLGCPAIVYLALCGVGKITVVDDDKVEASNLQRQIIYRAGDIGEAKAKLAAEHAQGLNPHIAASAVVERATADSLPGLVAGADVALDGSDNFSTRHAVNLACHEAQVALVNGAAERFDGQACVFDFARSQRPCYSCLFPPSQAVEPTPCALLGVYAPLTGMIGALMAAEAVRILAAMPTAGLQSRLLSYDCKDQRTRIVAIKPDPDCPVCAS